MSDRLPRSELFAPFGAITAWPSAPCYCGLHPLGIDHLAATLAELDPLWFDAAETRSRAAILAANVAELRGRGELVPDALTAALTEAEAAADDAQRIAELRDELDGGHDADPERAEG
ncbi:hypothetical protein GCM10025760_34290 [Microbacterium yannicii]|uniref:Uncharacterized protein n=1 Tax=Microbacterium yannicii TaxID=671622 RepID=A0ABP9MMD3_9MICO|nr:hypothetical protein [Microbacterium yannicii]MCO5951894.1 hypothetical protein [Microbacterium yannicii]